MNSLDLNYERDLWEKGHNYICGIDEVGRGAVSGPLVVACVGYSSDVVLRSDLYINDSKKLTQSQRNKAYTWIIENCLFYGLGQVDPMYIDKYGILAALKRAKQIAFDRSRYVLGQKTINAEINRVMIDGNDKHVLDGIQSSSQTNIIRGDAKVFSIASASIIAKVHRDALMHSYSLVPRFRIYDWSSNKGYGTRAHISAIKTYGPSPLHRSQYIRKYVSGS